MYGKKAETLSCAHKRSVLRYLMFLKQKRCGRLKGQGCADGRKWRLYKIKDQTSSPTIYIESLFISCMIDALGKSMVATLDILRAFMQADIDKLIHIKLVGKLVDLLICIDPSYEQFLT